MRYIILLIFWGIGFLLLWQVRTLRSSKHFRGAVSDKSPRVSVIIPARNEEQKIGIVLESLREQSFAPHEVLVVDDDSSDNTALIAQSYGVKVIKSNKIQVGWLGKPWACWQGAKKAEGDTLLFLDADTWLAKNGLEDIIQTFREKHGFITVQPYHITEKPYEQLSAFFNIIVLAGFNAFTILGDKLKPSGGFGPCAICLRSDYFAVGGHEAVKNSVIENSVLGGIFRARGYPLGCYTGKVSIFFRMYPDGFRNLFAGWSKSFAAGSTSISKTTFFLIILWVTGCFEAFIEPAKLIMVSDYKALWLPILIYLLYAAQIRWMLQKTGKFQNWTALFFPIPLAFFVFVMFWSVLEKIIFRKTKWKDRTVKFKS